MTEQQVTLREFIDTRLDLLMSANGDKHVAIMNSLQDIKDKQDETNGRVRNAEKAIAVLQVGYGVGAIILAGMSTYLLSKLP